MHEEISSESHKNQISKNREHVKKDRTGNLKREYILTGGPFAYTKRIRKVNNFLVVPGPYSDSDSDGEQGSMSLFLELFCARE